MSFHPTGVNGFQMLTIAALTTMDVKNTRRRCLLDLLTVQENRSHKSSRGKKSNPPKKNNYGEWNLDRVLRFLIRTRSYENQSFCSRKLTLLCANHAHNCASWTVLILSSGKKVCMTSVMCWKWERQSSHGKL